MKRDLDLIRALLTQFEGLPLDGGVIANELALEPWTKDQIVYHCFLMSESGLIHARQVNTLRGKNIIVLSLAAAGHDYLDAVRNDTIWNKVKARLEVEGTAGSLEIAKALALSFIMKKLGLN